MIVSGDRSKADASKTLLGEANFALYFCDMCLGRQGCIRILEPVSSNHLSIITDPRVNRTRDHELIDILMVAICALLCRAETFNDMEDFGKAKYEWFKTFLSLPNGIPSHDTFNRVFQALEPRESQQAFLNWTQSVQQAIPDEIVAMDGKALRRALTETKNPRYIVSAWAEDNGLVLGQRKVDEKSNEITAVPHLLRALELSGCIVTLDAMGCQKNIAKEIKEADADYVLALKGNQQTVHHEIATFLNQTMTQAKAPRPAGAVSAVPKSLATKIVVEKDHGRLETREYFQSSDLDWFADKSQWQGLQTVGIVQATREVNGKTSLQCNRDPLKKGKPAVVKLKDSRLFVARWHTWGKAGVVLRFDNQSDAALCLVGATRYWLGAHRARASRAEWPT